VTCKGWILSLLAALMLAALWGCGGSTTKNLQNPAAPNSPSVSISFHPAPPSSIVLNSAAALTAVVKNDPSNAGVDWALLCKMNTDCGTLSPLHTASGSAATYTPPAAISGNSQTFTIEAFATADHNQNLVTSIAVNGFDGNLKGTYVFQTRGLDANGPFQLAGVMTLDGSGGITSGEQTHSDPLLSVADRITGGSYYLGPDGRGTLTINTADAKIGQQGVENLSLVFLSNAQALIATLDNPNLALSNETSSGTLDLQTSVAPPQGGYAFAVSGTDISLLPMAMGGILNIDSPQAISGTGSVADQDDAGAVFPSAAVSGTVSNPDSFGAITFSLTATFASAPIQFTGYIVDATHIKLVESDINGSGVGVGSTGGLAIGQGAATGTFTANNSFSGQYVFELLGQDLTGIPTSLASIGQFSSDASGNLNNGYDDEFFEGFFSEIGDNFSGTYTLDSSGTGRVDSTINFLVNGPGPELIFYLTGNGNPALVLDADVNIGAVGAGLAYPQATSLLSFNGRYGIFFTQGVANAENDATAQVTVNGAAGTLSGVVDTSLPLSPQPNTTLTGTFGPIPSSGRFPGGLTNTFFPSPGSTPKTLAMDFYMIDSAHGFFFETDSLLSGDLSFGYFAARLPVCPTCP
jgi:hypothetical protein